MKTKLVGCCLLGLALILTLSISARPDRDDRRPGAEKDCVDSTHHEQNLTTGVAPVGVILVPGLPITSADIEWDDAVTERHYLADRSNSGVDIIDAENDVFAGRVTGMAGPNPSGGGTTTTNGPGPNGVVVTPNERLWAGDGNSLAQVADVNPNSPTYLQLLVPGGISTAWNNPLIPADTCDGGTLTTHYCGRADELAYDPKDHVIMIANNAPLSVTQLCPTVPIATTPVPHCPIDPYATFINADPPFNVLSHHSFVGAGGLEQPLWDAELGRFLVTVPGTLGVTPATIQVFNPTTFVSEKTFALDCQNLAHVASASVTGIALAPFQHILVSACGFPIILTLDFKTGTIHPLNVITQVGGGDEVWYNPGDGRFYVTGAAGAVSGAQQQLGVIDAETSTWLQNTPDVRGKNPAAFPENNHIFTVAQITAAIVAGATDDSICMTQFGVKGMGCIVVFTHAENELSEK